MKLYSFLSLLLFLPFLLKSTADELSVGDKVPDFQAKDDQGDTWKLSEYLGEKNIVVYFYPAAMTGGCTKQACAYRDYQSNLTDVDALVVGISGDEVKNLDLFKQAHNLNFTLLSDPDGSIAKKFGVPLRDGGSIVRNIAGEDFTLNRGVTSNRWTFVINKDGKVIYKDSNVNPEEDAKNVIAAIKND